MKIQTESLEWPAGWARTPTYRRKPSRFGDFSFSRCREDLLAELRRFGATRVVLGMDVPVRLDGLPYSRAAEPEDPGVAVRFMFQGKPRVIACDAYHRVRDNMRAVAKTIEAMRAIERHGASQLLERAVAGFSALPPGGEPEPEPEPERPWWEVLKLPKMEGMEWAELNREHPYAAPMLRMAEVMYKQQVPQAHPDRGGSTKAMQELTRAIHQAREVLNGGR